MVTPSTCFGSNVGHGPGKVSQENEMCLREEMENCLALYSQRVIAAPSVVHGSLLEIMSLNMVQKHTCGKG